jgi:hypothetical protein
MKYKEKEKATRPKPGEAKKARKRQEGTNAAQSWKTRNKERERRTLQERRSTRETSTEN